MPFDVGVLQGVELHPQHVALEAHGVDAGSCSSRVLALLET